jgi:hypothetical protein
MYSTSNFQPFTAAGQAECKGCNSVCFDNNNGGGIAVVIDNAWVVAPGTAKSISETDPRVRFNKNYNVAFDTTNAYGLNITDNTNPLYGKQQMVVVTTTITC